MSELDETLKKIAAGIQKMEPGTEVDSESHFTNQSAALPGDPECPYCHGIGYLREELPVGHPDFGKVQICSCRNQEINQQVHEHLFALSNLDALEHLTFDNFEPHGRPGLSPAESNSIEWTYNQAKIFSTNLKGWLLLQGGYGCGKTHLAAAIANFAVSIGVPTLFITVPDLLDSLRMTYNSQETTFEERFDQIRNAQLLILDDFGTQNATQWAQEKLFQIINYRYINELSTVITTNLPLDEIEERIQSRLVDPELVTVCKINAPDFRNPKVEFGRQKISLQLASEEMQFETFDLRKDEGLPSYKQKSLERAYNAAKKFAKNPEGWLIIKGPANSGKTHLALAIANYIFHHSPTPQSISMQAISVPEMLNYLRATFHPKSPVSLDRRFEEIRSTRILILDNLGGQHTTPWVREQLSLLFEYRYRNKLPTVITISDEIKDIDPTLAKRMYDPRLCRIYSIDVPSYFESLSTGKEKGYQGRRFKNQTK